MIDVIQSPDGLGAGDDPFHYSPTNCLPHMQRHSNILTDHTKYMYMLLMSRTVPFIRVPIH